MSNLRDPGFTLPESFWFCVQIWRTPRFHYSEWLFLNNILKISLVRHLANYTFRNHCSVLPISRDVFTPQNAKIRPIACLLTHWGRVTHICVSNLTLIGSDNLAPNRRQAIIWTNAGILLIGRLGITFIDMDILIEIHTFFKKKKHLKISSGKWRPLCLWMTNIHNIILYIHIWIIIMDIHNCIVGSPTGCHNWILISITE